MPTKAYEKYNVYVNPAFCVLKWFSMLKKAYYQSFLAAELSFVTTLYEVN